MTNLSQNATKNGRNEEFNSMIHNHYGGNSENIKILKMNQMIKNVENYDSLYHGNVHLNFRTGVPLLKNKLLAEVLLFSNGLITSKRDNIKPTFVKGNETSQSYQQQNYQNAAQVHGTLSHNQQYSNHFNLNGWDYQQISKPYNQVIDQRNIKNYSNYGRYSPY